MPLERGEREGTINLPVIDAPVLSAITDIRNWLRFEANGFAGTGGSCGPPVQMATQFALSEQFLDYLASDIRKSKVSPLKTIGQS